MSVSVYLLSGEIDANSAISDLVGRYLELVARHTTDDYVADCQAIIQRPALFLGNLVLLLAQSMSTAELLHTGDIYRVYLCSVIREQRCERSTHDLGAVDHGYPASEQPLSIIQESVVDLQVFEDLDAGQRSARQNRLLLVVRRVEEADVLIHVVDEVRAQTLDILVHGDNASQRDIARRVEDGVVDEDAVDGIVGVRMADLVFQRFGFDLAQSEVEATAQSCLSASTASSSVPHILDLRAAHFSAHVFAVQSAYMRAAGSVFARYPTR